MILLPAWLHLIMPPMHVAAQQTFAMPWLCLKRVCGSQSVPFDSDSVDMRGLAPVKTRIDCYDPNPYLAAPLDRA